MATYPQLDVNDLSEFSGRPSSEYTNAGYVATSLTQAILLFKIGTCRTSFPDDPIQGELSTTAILAMAEAIYNAQEYQKVLANPFSSETIGSYSYSKVAGAVANGLPTGVTWFDLAISTVSVCYLEVSYGGGIEVFEHDGVFVPGSGPNVRLLSPQDRDAHNYFMGDPAPVNYGVPQTPSEGGAFETPGVELDGGSF